jgi:riboflavin kinase/FMN adenylyltransferase
LSRAVPSRTAALPSDGAACIAEIFLTYRGPCVVTMGVFDGVHAGHRALVAGARRTADRRGLPLRAVTFTPRPDRVLAPADALPDLCSLDMRVARLCAAGADEVVVLPFSRAMAAVPAERFARLLVEGLGLAVLCVGPDFALGRDRVGDVSALRAMGLEVEEVPFLRDGAGAMVSSSLLREARARRTSSQFRI